MNKFIVLVLATILLASFCLAGTVDTTSTQFSTLSANLSQHSITINSPKNQTYYSTTIPISVTTVGTFSSLQFFIDSGAYQTYSAPLSLKLSKGCHLVMFRGLFSEAGSDFAMYQSVRFCIEDKKPASCKTTFSNANLENEKPSVCEDWKCKNNVMQRVCTLGGISYTEKSGQCGLVSDKFTSDLEQSKSSLIYLNLILILLILLVLVFLFILYSRKQEKKQSKPVRSINLYQAY